MTDGMPSEQYQRSVRSVGSHKAWSVDLEKGETQTEGQVEKDIDG